MAASFSLISGHVVCFVDSKKSTYNLSETEGTLPSSYWYNFIFFLLNAVSFFTDIHMIFNLVDASTSFQATETWTPICLPKFNDTGFLHAYVCYLPGDSNACLLLISTNREKFFELKQCKERVIEVCVC